MLNNNVNISFFPISNKVIKSHKGPVRPVCTADKRPLEVDNVDKKSEHVWYIVSMCTLQTMHLLRKHSVKYTTRFRLATTLVDFTADGPIKNNGST